MSLEAFDFITWETLIFIWVGILLLAPGIQVLWFKYNNPKQTFLMRYRAWEAQLNKKPYSISYQWTSILDMPLYLLICIWRSEDQDYFEHHGFVFSLIRKSIQGFLFRGQPLYGCSTITQQCARSTFLWIHKPSKRRPWVRKMIEAYYTVWMELLWSKRRILEVYLNVVEWGEGVFGVEASSQVHFKKNLAELSEHEIVQLVAMLPAPLVWNPNQETPRYLHWQHCIHDSTQKRDILDYHLKRYLSLETGTEINGDESI
ncbi:MAG: transglycosylase domain-containing protein [Cyanobacteria bacterium]|nr:transglycosylase domain-containing protein [Cyanobacteriota bacterium]